MIFTMLFQKYLSVNDAIGFYSIMQIRLRGRMQRTVLIDDISQSTACFLRAIRKSITSPRPCD